MPNIGMHPQNIFDVIIAGAGPAGCVLASRLSENTEKQVLLVEAGPDSPPGNEHHDVLDPFALMATHNRSFQWPGLRAEVGADPNDGSQRAVVAYPQGYGVGGASNINGMAADRGIPEDYNEWHEDGARGWDWDSVLPYFLKMERDLDFPTASSVHGHAGPMPVRRLPRSQWAPFTAAIADALEKMGFPFIEDYMTDFRHGFAATPTNCLLARRMSASMAYLTQDVRRRSNLMILDNARADRVNFDGRRASGLSVHLREETRLIQGRQVILACGALRSPQLLMLSGIGPAEHLAKHGIVTLADRPGVGANLQNHPTVTLTAYLTREAAQPRDNPWFLQNWLRFSSKDPACHTHDMHLMPFNKCDWHVLGARIGALAITVLKAYSRGRIDLQSSDPAAQPNVRHNLLSDDRDHDRLVSGLRFALKLLKEANVSRICHEIFTPNAQLVASLKARNVWNGLRASVIARMLDVGPVRRALLAQARIDPDALLHDERRLNEFVRMRARPQCHVSGTCRMGRPDNHEAVTDSAGRVHGVEGLRVADASIFPTVPRAYTHFPTIMAAEKIADSVKRD